jgi:TPR repeat protein
MNRMFKAAVVAFMLALTAAFGIVYFAELRAGGTHGRQLATESVAADPFNDGTNAYDRGEYAAAAQLLQSPADKGKADAQFLLGDMYSKGDGVPQNLADATKWYRKAANQGHAEAQFRLGFIYVEGLGVPQDYAEGVSWYLKAADRGDADAQLRLGYIYSDGQGVAQNYAEAVKWSRKAADQGSASAQWFLGTMYRDGRGVGADYVEAYMWFDLAASQLSPSDEATAAIRKLAEEGRTAVAALMTPAQIVEAQRSAREWKPSSVR